MRKMKRARLAVQRGVALMLGNRRKADLIFVRTFPGWFSRKEAGLIYDVVLGLTGPGALAEIGSWLGKSTVAIGLAVEASRRPDDVIYAIDHHQGGVEPEQQGHEVIKSEGTTYNAFLANIERGGVADRIKPLKMTSVEACEKLTAEGIKLKFLFVDGAHDEESVARDLEIFLPLLLPGAFIAMDDAKPEGKHPGVYRAFQRVLEPISDHVGWGRSLLVVRLNSKAPQGLASV